MLHSTVPLDVTFPVNEQRWVKAVRVSGTDRYGKEWAGCSADWYSAVGEG